MKHPISKLKRCLFTISCVVLLSVIAYYYWTGLPSRMKKPFTYEYLSHYENNHMYKSRIPSEHSPFVTKLSPQSTLTTFASPIKYSQFQLLNDNFTHVYAGYYDDRDVDAVVKVIAIIPKNIRYNFTCTVYYPDSTVIEGTGFLNYHFTRAAPFLAETSYRHGFIVCPVPRNAGRPTMVSLQKEGVPLPPTDVIVEPPPEKKNNLTRCISPMMNNYSDVSQLISTIEFHRLFGVDRYVIYVEDASERVLRVLLSYESNGIVEVRNFSKPSQRQFRDKVKGKYWGQWASYHDCHLSQMYSAKYVMFGDLDEVLVPRKHTTILEMVDDLFSQTDQDSEPTGSLNFRNVYYPTFKNRTSVTYPHKDLALKYNIYPLLYTTRMKTNGRGIVTKTIVRPLTVDLMWIHHVERFRKGWGPKWVNEDIATTHHYRSTPNRHMHPPEGQDNYMLRFSVQITSAVKKAFEKFSIDVI